MAGVGRNLRVRGCVHPTGIDAAFDQRQGDISNSRDEHVYPACALVLAPLPAAVGGPLVNSVIVKIEM
jgi:hypothetical protein